MARIGAVMAVVVGLSMLTGTGPIVAGLAPSPGSVGLDERDLAASLPPAGADALHRAADARADAESLAQDLAAAPTLAALFDRSVAADASGRFAPDEALPLPDYGSLEEALVALSDASGHAADLAAFRQAEADLDPALRGAVIDLVEGLVAGAALQRQALAGLAPGDAAALLGSGARERDGTRLAAPGPDEALLAKVDLGALAAGGRAVARAVDEALPRLQAVALALPPPAVAATPGCVGPGPNLLNVAGLVGIANAPSFFADDYVLSIALGNNNDVYCNNAGGTLDSGTATLGWDTDGVACSDLLPPHPVAVALDLGGNDNYHSAGTDASGSFRGCFEGAGFLGIGVLVDVAGDDAYNSQKRLTDVTAPCPAAAPGTTMPAGGPVDYHDFVSQGAGILGVGIMADLVGDDLYDSGNTVCSSGSAVPADFRVGSEGLPGGLSGVSVAGAAQGGANVGIGVFLDGGGFDDYNSGNSVDASGSLAPHQWFDVSLAQGAAAAGIGVHLDLGANFVNNYNTGNTITASPAAPAFDQSYLAGWSQGHGELGGVGVFVNNAPFNRYNSFNTMTSGGDATSTWTAYGDQGAGFFGLGVFVDHYPYDEYNSWNSISAPVAYYGAFLQQGAASTGIGVALTKGGNYNTGNSLTGGAVGAYNPVNPPPFLPALATPASTVVDIQGVQGAAWGPGALGVHVETGWSGWYNSFNAQNGPLDYARIVGAQGAAISWPVPVPDPSVVGVFLQLSGFANTYNHLNSGGGGIVIAATEGASGFPVGGLLSALTPFALGGGIGIMADVGTKDVYEGNAFPVAWPPGGCTLPFSLGTCVDWTHGVALLVPPTSGPLVAAFIDVWTAGPAPDAYSPVGLGAYGLASFGTAPLGICLDLFDNLDPIPPAGLLCVDT